MAEPNVPEGFLSHHILTGEPLNYELKEDWHYIVEGNLNEGLEVRIWLETTTGTLTEEHRTIN